MYTIYVDNNLIYSPTLIEDGYCVINPRLQMELNSTSSLEFKLPVGSEGYNKINKLKSIVKVYDGNVRVFMGRCLSDELTMINTKSIYCEGELGFLQDSIQRAYTFEGTVEQYFTFLINRHNSQVDANKRFRVGNVTVGDDEDIIKRESTNYLSTYDEIKDQLIDTLGGYIMPRYEVENGVEVQYIDYLSDSGGLNSQIIEFGSNLLDFTQKLDGQEIFTVLVPLGASQGKKGGVERRLTIASVNDNKDYLEDVAGIAQFGRITKSMIWDNVKKANILLAKGRRALASGVNIIPQISLSAVDMHVLDVNVEAIKLGEYNRFISPPHNIDTQLQCSEITLNLEDPTQSQYTFGATGKSISSINANNNKQINAVINQVSEVLEDINEINDEYDDLYDSVGLISANVGAIETKTDTIETGAQVNTIETIMVNGIPIEITDKTVNIEIPTT